MFDPIEIQIAAQEAADIIAEQGGGGGGMTIPHFDLAAMGLATVPIGGQVVMQGSFAEIEAAMKVGLISASFRCNMGSGEVDASGAFVCCYSSALGAVQGNATLFAGESTIRFVLAIDGNILALQCAAI